VLFCQLTAEQRMDYEDYLGSKDVQDILGKERRDRMTNKVLACIMNLRKICNHPDLMLPFEKVST
jgi:SNF2 family DNA or RNA helicase